MNPNPTRVIARLRGASKIARGLLWAGLGSVVAAELILQVASVFAPGRESLWKPHRTHRILCVGDSHTYGAGVEPGQAYPGQLQRFLDQMEPGVDSVINLGLPGSNTTQLRHRIPDWLSRYQPDLLIVWAGANNGWNTAELEDEPPTLFAWLDRQLMRSRFYRLIRVRIHDRKLEHYATKSGPVERWHIDWNKKPLSHRTQRATIRYDGVIETVVHSSDGKEDLGRIGPRVMTDLTGIAHYARTAGVPLIFLTYPLDFETFDSANRAIWRVAKQFDIPVLDSAKSLARVPPKQRKWLWAMHPNAPIYREIARDVADLVVHLPQRKPAQN